MNYNYHNDDKQRGDAPEDLGMARRHPDGGGDDPVVNIYSVSQGHWSAPRQGTEPYLPGGGDPSAQGQTWQEPAYRSVAASESYYSPGGGAGPGRAPEKGRGRPRRGRAVIRVASLLLACAVIGGAAGYGVTEYRIWNGDLGSESNVVLGSTAPPVASGNDAARDETSNLIVSGKTISPTAIYNMACNQVVGVQTVGRTGGFSQTEGTLVSGSGFIISTDGYIMTNHHVVEAAIRYGYAIKVVMHDGTTYDAKVVGTEADNDIAVLKINAAGLDAVTIGSMESTVVGEDVYAVGNPLGELAYTMTDGMVSALDRSVTVQRDGGGYVSINMFQFTAAVNSGNSGGPVYNAKGEVIGVVSAKYASAGVEGLGFAIPIDDAISIAEQLITNGYVTGKAYLGISVRTVTRTTAEYWGMVEGAYVVLVESGSCAETADLRPGDIITGLGDAPVKTTEDLKDAKRAYKAGDTVAVTVNRGGETLTLTLTFDEEGAAAQQGGTVQQGEDAPSIPYDEGSGSSIPDPGGS